MTAGDQSWGSLPQYLTKRDAAIKGPGQLVVISWCLPSGQNIYTVFNLMKYGDQNLFAFIFEGDSINLTLAEVIIISLLLSCISF